MVRVKRSGTTRYHGVSYKPYQEFLIEDKDKAEMVKLGCVVIEDKVVNKNKVEEPKVEEPKAKVNPFSKKEDKKEKVEE